MGAFRAVGVLMGLSFLVMPALTAKILAKSVFGMVGWSLVFGVIGAIMAPVLSRSILSCYGIGLSTAGLIVAVFFGLYVLTQMSVIGYRKLLRNKQISYDMM